MERIRIACCQFRAKPADCKANIERMSRFAREAAAAGARIVVYPELIVTGYLTAPDRIESLAESHSGATVEALARVASSVHVGMAFGFPERGEDGACHNSLAFVTSAGKVAAVYRKTHLFDTEKSWARPGASSAVLDYEGARVGGWICYDTRFPELARAQALAGAELAVVATAWLGPGEEWELALRARALDNGMFVAGADIIDPDIGCRGRSLVVDPHGRVVARACWDEEGLLLADIDPDVMARQRARVPLLTDRRPDAYGTPAL